MKKTTSFLKANYFSILSRLIATYFLILFHIHVDSVTKARLTETSATYLALFIFFLVLPFAQRLKLGKLIEFEAKVERTRAEIKEVRTETRDLISTLSVMVNTISASMNQSVILNLPTSEEGREARKNMSNVVSDSPESTGKEKKMLEYVRAGEFDVHYALARLRMDLERQLRRVLRKRLETADPLKMRGKFLTARSLFRQLTSVVPRYKQMQSSFDYIMKFCNAAIHGQRIPESSAHEAIDMGLDILQELDNEGEL